MERNVGGLDRSARLVVGPLAALVGVAMILDVLPYGVAVGAVLVVVGAILLGTGLTQKCPIHRVLGVNTCQRA